MINTSVVFEYTSECVIDRTWSHLIEKHPFIILEKKLKHEMKLTENKVKWEGGTRILNSAPGSLS